MTSQCLSVQSITPSAAVWSYFKGGVLRSPISGVRRVLAVAICTNRKPTNDFPIYVNTKRERWHSWHNISDVWNYICGTTFAMATLTCGRSFDRSSRLDASDDSAGDDLVDDAESILRDVQTSSCPPGPCHSCHQEFQTRRDLPCPGR